MKLKEGIVVSIIDESDGGVLFDMNSGSYYRINDTMCFIIEYIKENIESTTNDIVKALCNEYDVDIQTARNDVSDIITEFKN